VRVEFLTSTPPTPTEGSGTFVALDGLQRGLVGLGHHVSLRPLRFRSGLHTLDRWLYNAAVLRHPPGADLVVGVDLDGFLWARGRAGRSPYVVALKGIIADELRNERGLVRASLALQARWERTNTECADRVIVPSRYSAAVAADVYGIEAARLAVVPEPVDIGAWQGLFASIPRRAAGPPTVLSVARMYPRKRLQDLVQAAAILRRSIPEVRVRIVGEGPEGARLRALHRTLDLADTVSFLGEVSRHALAVEYRSADVFCLPTVQEGFGIVFAEAMIAGLPVVASRIAAVPEIVEDRRTGLLVNPRSPDELAMALETLLLNEGLRVRLGDAGMNRVQRFDLEPVARAFLRAAPLAAAGRDA
jgi:glycosyltransferase involved in cell wall biosynthesis